MKRKLFIILFFVLVLTVTACSPSANDESVGELSEGETPTDGLSASISVQVEEDWREYYEQVIERVKEKHPDTTIELIEIGSFDHLDVLDETNVKNKDVADVFALPANRIYGLSINQALAPMDAKAMAENIGGFINYDEGLGGSFNIEGDYLAFPMNIETLISFVNTANAGIKGIDFEREIEFTDLAYQDMLVPAFDLWFGIAFTNAGGIELLGFDESGELYSDFTKDFSELDEQQKLVFTALYEYWNSHNINGSPFWDANVAWEYMDVEFSAGGQNSIRLEDPRNIGSFLALTKEGKELEIIPINQVIVEGYPLTQLKSGWGLGINSRNRTDDEKMALSQAVIEEIMNKDYAIDFFKASGKIMGHVSVDEYLDSDITETDKKVIVAVIESYDVASSRPLFIEWEVVWDTWKKGLLSWNSVNPESVEEAYDTMKTSFESMMSDY